MLSLTRPFALRNPALGAALLFAFATPAAHAAGIPTLQEVTVSTRNTDLIGVADSASEGTVTARQLASRPLLRPAEVLEVVPGLIVTQHSGDGKANQYFLRGFNLDHGSDFATRVMGMPINMVSHAHGQGYMDLNFLIPELVGSVKYRKGVYEAEDGDFATSGSARIDYQRRLAAPFVDLSIGQHNYRRLLSAGSTRLDNGFDLLAGIELAGNDGPWDQPEKLKKRNAVFRLSSGTAADGFALTAMLYKADWTASEHVPERAIRSGEIGRYGTLVPNDGGQTHRYSLSGEWARSGERDATRASVYVVDYGLNLFSAPSGYIGGLQGDQHEQADERLLWGGEARQSWFLGPEWKDSEVSVGAQLRQDRIGKVGLYTTENRQRSATVREDRITETAYALFADARTQWTPWLRTSLGARYDEIHADATARGGVYNMDNGGSVRARQTSPKLGAVFGPFPLLGPTEFYANWGHGFHSNDARGATARHNPQDGSAADPVPLIVKARGSELGIRTTPLPGWNSSLSIWRMKLASELVFIGDEGITEPKGASHRYGLEWSNYFVPAPGWIADLDVALSRARFDAANPDNGGRRVPNAIPLTASAGLGMDNGGPWFGGLRWRYIGAYDLEETGEQKSRAFGMLNLKAGYRVSKQLQVTVDVLNLFDRKANDIEYWGGACTRSEALAGTGGCGSGGAIDGRLVHPLEPRSVRLSLRFSL
ncbi:TonB-dependent receptor [Zoogloea dura]|uniref:TonB-dependent receptor n=1 Tax=Zoogloea dura TaxID=2728840 RepID=A0A848FX09_9RHOO|nr:TonB-dependent receptor [Zoogloea dura]NML24467.1 TonB-dependent receptor [Zoogloea dura]